MRIYVGNLSKDTTEDDLRPSFEEFGQIDSVTIMKDKFSGVSKGFGFVDIPSKEEGLSAIEGLNNKELNGKSLQVNEARPRPDNRGSFGSSNKKRGFSGKGNQSGNNKWGSGGQGRYGGNNGRRDSNR